MKYNVGDIVELVYCNIIGSGEIIKINKGFLGTTYWIKTTITSTNPLTYECVRKEVINIKEKDIIKILRRNE